MSYLANVAFSSKAEKYLRKLDKPSRDRILQAIKKLMQVPPEGDVRLLRGKSDSMRCRVGDFRIIFQQDHENDELKIILIHPRGQVYKNL
ncbi:MULTISPECIES: type II toxin-antitoxin system RelE family toxin [Oceanobacillus]|uniref:type II toxin-antitoxin system RelE family toxin n=1 Tax=Oceanobacillus TaxID=182709 RepID=UPI0005963A7F|nr:MULTISPECIES: type II toxin-antitoxin system RelE/ParE family toxin [Oceanobacillus]